jgi:hypothetical protein
MPILPKRASFEYREKRSSIGCQIEHPAHNFAYYEYLLRNIKTEIKKNERLQRSFTQSYVLGKGFLTKFSAPAARKF